MYACLKPIHVSHWGTFIKTLEVSNDGANIQIELKIDNDSKQSADIGIIIRIFEINDKDLKTLEAFATFRNSEIEIEVEDSKILIDSLSLKNPKLWGPPPTQKTKMYVVVTSLTKDNQIIDKYKTKFGARSL